ncbi:MAG: CBS domain-containing protein [Candidatus Aenigmarchaeota archaeon]|nr:CBS domain-containing protein [Candidatus Aenigmarchaeota archaeon]
MLPNIEDIERRRKSLGLTQKSLAILANVSQSTIAKIESKKVSPSYAIAKKIFDILESLEKKSQITAKQILTPKVIFIQKSDRVEKAARLMREYGYSQLPIFDRNRVIGSISERTILDQISKGKELSDLLEQKVKDIMEEAFPTVTERESLPVVLALLQNNHAVLVTRKGKIVGIITKADLLKAANFR